MIISFPPAQGGGKRRDFNYFDPQGIVLYGSHITTNLLGNNVYGRLNL
ncbi:MAG: hypothetical protein LBR79_06380 [Oscillospiraceae bacterium]|nr:hypothetical protein [Oscillospiraceae bacterium]